MRICWSLAVLVIACGAQPRPLRRTPLQAAARDISILSVDFQELRYGHEGPGYFATERTPLRGQREIAEVSLFGQDAIETVRFELVGRTGVVLAAGRAFRVADAADATQYMVRVDVPAEPFLFRVSGQDTSGRPYAAVFQRLFVPAEGTPRQAEYAAGLSAKQRQMMEAAAAEVQSRFDADEAQRAIRIPRSTVTGATYEPLFSRAGRPIGVRICFVVRFERAGVYALTPVVFPLYQDFRWRGVIEMKVLDAEAAPMSPEVTGALLLGGRARYEAKVDYHLAFDLTPNYIIRNTDRTRYCMDLQSLRTTGRMAVWQSIQESAEPVKYRVVIFDVEFAAETAPWTAQRTFYETFLSEGARDCGPTPNVHF